MNSSVRESVEKMTGWLHLLSEFGLALIFTFLVVDVLFPGSTGLIHNVGEVVGQFSKQGLTGLIALLLFLVLFKKSK